MSWVIFDAEGDIEKILNDPEADAMWIEIPEGYPETHIWDIENQCFIPSIEKARRRKKAEITMLRDAHIVGGADTALGVMDSDPLSITKVNGAVVMAMLAQSAGQPFEIGWTMKDNTTITHTADQMIAAGLAVGQHVSQCHDIGVALKAAIDAATTIEEVEAVEWPI